MNQENKNLEQTENSNDFLANVSGSTAVKEQCPEFPYFGARYPDARCIEGYLHDMDNCDENGNVYIMDENNPCPFCNTKEFMQEQKDNEVDLEKVRQWMEGVKKRYG